LTSSAGRPSTVAVTPSMTSPVFTTSSGIWADPPGSTSRTSTVLCSLIGAGSHFPVVGTVGDGRPDEPPLLAPDRAGTGHRGTGRGGARPAGAGGRCRHALDGADAGGGRLPVEGVAGHRHQQREG